MAAPQGPRHARTGQPYGQPPPSTGADPPGMLDDTKLVATARQVLERARRTDPATLNESNAKATLIEPLLDALGWDVLNLDSVSREYPVHDGTFLDYALLVDGRPALFCEAKPPRKRLDDPKWVAQTVNYGNNEGVAWCVLTDG